MSGPEPIPDDVCFEMNPGCHGGPGCPAYEDMFEFPEHEIGPLYMCVGLGSYNPPRWDWASRRDDDLLGPDRVFFFGPRPTPVYERDPGAVYTLPEPDVEAQRNDLMDAWADMNEPLLKRAIAACRRTSKDSPYVHTDEEIELTATFASLRPRLLPHVEPEKEKG